MKKTILGATIISILAIFNAGCDKKDANSLVSTKNLSQALTLTSNDGKPITLEYTGSGFKVKELEGKATLVVFFATWCPPCKAEIPHLVALQEKYKNDFAVVAVLLEENKSKDEISAFMTEHKINYLVANSPANFDAAEAFGGVKGIPTMFMFDKNGKQTAFYPGATPEEIIEKDILKTLGK
ncbi:MAG: TlpA disulfide reductase family protein [Campylobacterales bacterium]|nr:TlpA disulfide reductase family protein [Campylobacterales bacterium]